METYATMSVDVQGNHLAGAPWRQHRADSPAEAAMLRTRTTSDTHYVSTVAMPNGRTLVVLAPIATGTVERVIVMVADDVDAPVTLSGPVGQREEDIVHDVILDGLADRSEGSADETPVMLDLVDFTDPTQADQAGVKPGAYVREANDYGQRVTYRFATREAADRYMDEISAGF